MRQVSIFQFQIFPLQINGFPTVSIKQETTTRAILKKKKIESLKFIQRIQTYDEHASRSKKRLGSISAVGEMI